jgi:hypothetical protein
MSGASKYLVQISSTTDFSADVRQYRTLRTSIDLDNLEPGKQYFWHVRAENDGGVSEWSATSSFFVASGVAAAPAIQFPAKGTTDVSPAFELAWESVDQATSYQVRILREIAEGSPEIVLDSTVTSGAGMQVELEGDTPYQWQVRAHIGGAWSGWSELANFRTAQATDTAVGDDGELPQSARLQQNYPNPFNPMTTIPFELAEATQARLAIYNALGEEVAVLADGIIAPGTHTVTWDAADFPSGTYFYMLQTPGSKLTRSLILIK